MKTVDAVLAGRAAPLAPPDAATVDDRSAQEAADRPTVNTRH